MRFSKDGPEIPVELIEASIRGEVIFLCGAGVSQSSGLPNFKTLTERIFVRLGETMDPAEKLPYEKERFEETLGSLARRLVDKRGLYTAVAEELHADTVNDLSPHETLLRLSRDFESRPTIVTTNFDTLLERALNKETGLPVRDLSFASAQVPAPGGPRFEGIIHLHGRLADAKHNLDGSDLVLTSADYGDAYLRSGWASRFLFDLARTRTIVLVGYSASDPPVRYILNILEADRERFPDIKSVYALDAHTVGKGQENAAAWEAIAVSPILYELMDDDYRPFWKDLSAWADVSETPRAWRKARLEAMTANPFDTIEEWERNQAAWIFGHDDAVALLSKINMPPVWLEFLRTHKAWRPSNSTEWPLAQWAANRLHDNDAFREMLGFVDQLGPAAAGIIDRGLVAPRDEPVPAHLEKAWHLLTIIARTKRDIDHWHRPIALGRVRSNQASSSDLIAAIVHYAPRLRLRAPYSFDLAQDKEGLSGLCRVELEPDRDCDINELLNAFQPESQHIWPALQIASDALLRSLRLALDAEQAGASFERASIDVPSISAHDQNEHHGSVLPLTRVCAELWLKVCIVDQEKASAIAELWKHAGFALTTRLWLFTLHEDLAVPPGDIIQCLLDLPTTNFWAHRKEVLELLRDRCRGASLDQISKLTTRILNGPELSQDRTPEDKQRGLDSTVWLHLKALAVGNVQLPDQALAEFQKINARRGWMDRNLEEQDLFWMWSYGAQYGPQGDPAPIAEADTTKRIEIAADLERRDSFNQSDVWRVYCKQDPAGALDAAMAADAAADQADRWRDVLWSIQEIGNTSDEAKAQGRTLSAKALAHLDGCEDAKLAKLSSPLVDLYGYALKIESPINDLWWDRLWKCATTEDGQMALVSADKDPGYDLISHAINAPAGKLAEMMINRLGPSWQALPGQSKERTKARLSSAIGSPVLGGLYARAEITRYVAWLDASLPELVDGELLSCLNADSSEGEALRSILVGMSPSHNMALRAKLKEPILRGICEHRGHNDTAENAAARLVAYVRDDLKREADDPKRLKSGDAKAVFCAARSEILAAAAEVMGDWLSREQDTPAHDRWLQEFSKIFYTVWPAGKKHQTRMASLSLAKLAVASGEAFPDAWNTIKPYIINLDEDWPSLYFATTEQAKSVADTFPRQMLDLLWTLLRPATRGQSHELAEVLDRIALASPTLARDRRFQLLETRAMRLE